MTEERTGAGGAPTVAHITVFCPDATGLVASITGFLFELGANLGDTTFSVLGRGAEFAALAELPVGITPGDVESGLRDLPALQQAEVSVRPFVLDPRHGPLGEVTHRIVVGGGDQPGLIARLCETFPGFGANIVTLNAGPSPDPASSRYTIRLAVSIPPAAAAACLATVSNTAQSLGLTCRWEPA
jgi:glycine cleavage system transcriptional repressor